MFCLFLGLLSGKFLTYDWCDPGTEQLDGMHDFTVRHRADIESSPKAACVIISCAVVMLPTTPLTPDDVHLGLC